MVSRRGPRATRGLLAALLGLGLLAPPAAAERREIRAFELAESGPEVHVTLRFDGTPAVKTLESGSSRRYILAFPGSIYRPTRTRKWPKSHLAKKVTLSQHDRRTVWLVVDRDPASRIEYERSGGVVTVRVQPPASGRGPRDALVRADGKGAAEVGPPPLLVPTREPGTRPRIVIDPGHGGRDPGAVGKRTTDKEVALAVARHLKRILDADERVEVHFTRLEDRFVKLEDRAALARRVGADLFVSLHANSGHPSAHGYEVWYLSMEGSRGVATKIVSDRENAYASSQGGRGVDGVTAQIERIRIDMLRETNLNKSSLLAGFMNKSLEETGQRSRGVQHADFAVLRSVDVPSVLLELGFLSNRREETNLMSPAFQAKQAGAIYKGLLAYLESQGLLEGKGGARTLHYAVRPRDTLGVVGERFRVDPVDLAEANGLRPGATLYVGQVLTIPRDPIAALIGEHIE